MLQRFYSECQQTHKSAFCSWLRYMYMHFFFFYKTSTKEFNLIRSHHQKQSWLECELMKNENYPLWSHYQHLYKNQHDVRLIDINKLEIMRRDHSVWGKRGLWEWEWRININHLSRRTRVLDRGLTSCSRYYISSDLINGIVWLFPD